MSRKKKDESITIQNKYILSVQVKYQDNNSNVLYLGVFDEKSAAFDYANNAIDSAERDYNKGKRITLGKKSIKKSGILVQWEDKRTSKNFYWYYYVDEVPYNPQINEN